MTAKEKAEVAAIMALSHMEARGDDEEIIEALREERSRVAAKYGITEKHELAAIKKARKSIKDAI